MQIGKDSCLCGMVKQNIIIEKNKIKKYKIYCFVGTFSNSRSMKD